MMVWLSKATMMELRYGAHAKDDFDRCAWCGGVNRHWLDCDDLEDAYERAGYGDA